MLSIHAREQAIKAIGKSAFLQFAKDAAGSQASRKSFFEI
jgi:hypothetical protein